MKPKYHSNDQHLLSEPCYGKTKKIKIWVNGEAECYIFNINPKDFRTWALILYHISQEIKPSFGAVKRLIELKSRKVVLSFEELDPSKKYIALGLTCNLKVPLGGYKTNAEIYDAEKLAGKRIPIYKDPQVTENKNFLKQTEKLKNTVIYVAINGKNDPPHKAVFKEHELHDWEMIRSYMAQILSVHDGIKHFCTIYGEVLEDPRDFQHGYLYVAVPFAESFTKMDYRGLFMKKYKYRKSRKTKKTNASTFQMEYLTPPDEPHIVFEKHTRNYTQTTDQENYETLAVTSSEESTELIQISTYYELVSPENVNYTEFINEQENKENFNGDECFDIRNNIEYYEELETDNTFTEEDSGEISDDESSMTQLHSVKEHVRDQENYKQIVDVNSCSKKAINDENKYDSATESKPENIVLIKSEILIEDPNKSFDGQLNNVEKNENSGEISNDKSSNTQFYSVKELVRDQKNYKQIVDVNSRSEKVINNENNSATESKPENIVLIESEILIEDPNKSFDGQLNNVERNENSEDVSDDEISMTQFYCVSDQENYKQIVYVNSSSEKVINDENKYDSATESKSENIVLIKSEILKEDSKKSFDAQLNNLEKNEDIIKQEISEIYEQFLSGRTLEEHENDQRKYFLNSDDRLKYFDPEITHLDTNNETFTPIEKMFDSKVFKYAELKQQNLIDNKFNSVIFIPDTSSVLGNENLYQEFKSQPHYSPGYLGVPEQKNSSYSKISKKEIETYKRVFSNSCSDILYCKKGNIKSLETRDNNIKEKNNYQQTRTSQKVCNPLFEIIGSASNCELEKQNNFIQENNLGADYNYLDKSNLQLENQEQTLPQEVYEHVQQCETCKTGEIISQFNKDSGNINQLGILPQLCDVKDEIIDPIVYELIINISQCKPKDNEQNLSIIREDNQEILVVSNYSEESFKHSGQNKNSENVLIDTKCIEQNFTIKECNKQQIMTQIKFEKDTGEIKYNSCQVTCKPSNNTKLATSLLDDNKILLTCANLRGEVDLTDKFSEETHSSVQKPVSFQLIYIEESPVNTESQKCEQEGDELDNEILENYYVLNDKSSSKQLNYVEHKSNNGKSQPNEFNCFNKEQPINGREEDSLQEEPLKQKQLSFCNEVHYPKGETEDFSNQKTTTNEQENSKEEDTYKCLAQELFLEEEQPDYDYTSPDQCELCISLGEFDYEDVREDELEYFSNSVSGVLIENIREQSVKQNINQENLKSFYITAQLSNDLDNLLTKVDLIANRQDKSEGTEICQQFIKQVATPVIELISELQQTIKDPLHSASTSVSLLKEDRDVDVLTEPADFLRDNVAMTELEGFSELLKKIQNPPEITSSEAQTDGRVTGVPIKTMRECNSYLHRNIISLPLRFTDMHRASKRCCKYSLKDGSSLSKCIVNVTHSIKDYQQKLAEVEQEMDGDPNVEKLIKRKLSSTRPSKVSKKYNMSTGVI